MSELEGEATQSMTVGEQLRAAREAAKLSIDDVATSTRIPTRHLASLEASDFARLPAPTYSVGFARSYAAAVGLDRNMIGEQLRAELGGTRPAQFPAEQFEPVDPARAMPKWLILAAVAAIAAVAQIASWLSSRSLNAPDEVAAEQLSPDPAATAAAPPPAAAAAAGPVTITATDAAWVQIRDGETLLKEGILQPGERFDVPPTATAPTLTTAKAEALTINVGTAVAPAIGPPATRVSNVSLKAADLLRPKPAAAAATPAATPARTAAAPPRPAPRPASRSEPRAAAPPPPAQPAANVTDPQPAQ